MPRSDSSCWTERLRQTLESYEEPLLRQVAALLIRPRNHWPAEDLIERSLATIGNPAVIDRRLQDLQPAARQLLALIAHARQPAWAVGNLVEIAVALGHPDGLSVITDLCESGLLYPVPPAAGKAGTRLKSFTQCFAATGTIPPTIFAHPHVTARALGEDLGLPELPVIAEPLGHIHEADGLEWPLRLAVLWQMVTAGPLRRTQGGAFFKRDQDRLQQDTFLNLPPTENLADLPDLALFIVALAEVLGIVCDVDGELRAASLPGWWQEGLPQTLESLYAALFRPSLWNPQEGFRDPPGGTGNPFPSAYLLALMLLARQRPEVWVRPSDVESWLRQAHPFWMVDKARRSSLPSWMTTFLLGVAYPLRLVQVVRHQSGERFVRLSSLGRWLLGVAELPASPPVHAQTLLVQPNLEILAYRQGLTPGLIIRLGCFATWKGLGPACTLQLQPESVYRALEAGLSIETILQTLEQHGTRAIPPSVIDSLRTWSQKRDRITLYPAAALLEFGSSEELGEALARGLAAVRLSDRLALVPHEDLIDYRHFRLIGTRDYSLPPDRCVTVEADGVTLTIDLARSDLLLETELPRFAVPVERATANGRRQFRLTPESLAAAREGGLSIQALETWFLQRTGVPLSPAARLLLSGPLLPPSVLRRHLVLHLPAPEVADGLLQWPQTRGLIAERLGPTALAVLEEKVDRLREQLVLLGLSSMRNEG